MAKLKRVLGLPALTFTGVGMILGAGIYSVLGRAAGQAGSAVWQSFALGSVVALLSALSYAELATAYPKAGAEYVYLQRALPRWPSISTVTGLLVAASGAATAAAVAIAFAGYLNGFFEVPERLVALALLAVLAAVNLVGIRESAWMNVALTLVEAGGLVLFVSLGARDDAFGHALASPPTAAAITASSLVFFSFLGFENIANLAEEARDPRRDLARAILLSLGIATALYVLVALAAVALVPPAELAASDEPLATAAAASAPRLARVLGAVALFATANTALISMMVASRLVYGMARGGALPRPLGAIWRGRETPAAATLVVFGAAAALVPLGRVELVASLSSFAALVAFALVNLALILLRFREPRRRRPFRVPLALGRFPVLPALGLAACLALATRLELRAILAGSAVVAVGLLIGVARARGGSRAPRRAR